MSAIGHAAGTQQKALRIVKQPSCLLRIVTWRNSLKSAVVGGGDGEFTENEQGDWRQLDDAGDRLELGVAVSQYLRQRRASSLIKQQRTYVKKR